MSPFASEMAALLMWRLGRAANGEATPTTTTTTATPLRSAAASPPSRLGSPASSVGSAIPHTPATPLQARLARDGGAEDTDTGNDNKDKAAAATDDDDADADDDDSAWLPSNAPPSPPHSGDSLCLGEALAVCRRWRDGGRLVHKAVLSLQQRAGDAEALAGMIRGNIIGPLIELYKSISAGELPDMQEEEGKEEGSGARDGGGALGALDDRAEALLLSLTLLLRALAGAWQCRATLEQSMPWRLTSATLSSSGNASIVAATAALASSLARGSQDARMAMVDCGLPGILLARSKYAHQPSTLAPLCEALLALAINVEGRRQIVEASGVRVIVHHAQHPGALAENDHAPEARAVVESCVCLLSTLTWNDDSVISQLVACGGLELLVAQLETAEAMSQTPQRQLASMTAHVALSSPGRCRRLVELGALHSVAMALAGVPDASIRDAMLHCLAVLITGLPQDEDDILLTVADDCEQSLRRAAVWTTNGTAFSRILPALQAIAARTALSQTFVDRGVFDDLVCLLQNPESPALTMDVCEALRALLRGTPRPVIIRAATSLLLRTSSKRESAAAATLLWSIAYAPAATDTLLDLGVVQALLTTARKQEKDTAAYRAVLGALDSLILSPKAAAIFLNLKGVQELVRAARMAFAMEPGVAREDLLEVALHAMVNLMVASENAVGIVAPEGVGLFLDYVSDASAALCNPRLVAVCIAGLRCLSAHPRPLRALQSPAAALQLLALVRQSSDLHMAIDLLAVLRRVVEGPSAADAVLKGGGVRQLLAFKARAANASANDANRLHVLCHQIITRLEQDDGADTSIVTEV